MVANARAEEAVAHRVGRLPFLPVDSRVTTPTRTTMAGRRTLLAAVASFIVLSCGRGGASSTPAPAPASRHKVRPAAGQQVTTLAPRRPPPSRDSLEKLRAVYVAQIMGEIAGRENQPADQVFKNVQVLKGITAAELVHKMDKECATPLSWNCTNCHRLATQGTGRATPPPTRNARASCSR
jgi:hypothetical protein